MQNRIFQKKKLQFTRPRYGKNGVLL